MLLAKLILSGVTVTLPMEATSRGTELTLGEIATITGADAALVEQVESLDLGYAPQPGFSRLLHAQRIQQTLARELPGVQVRLVGESAIRVRPEVARIASAQIRAAAEAELARAFAERDVTYEPNGKIADVTVPAGSAPPVVRARLDTTEAKTGTIAVPVEILVDGEIYRTVWSNWKTVRWETMPVLKRAVRGGQRLQPYDLENRRVRVEVTQRKALPASLLAGAIAARDLNVGTPVTEADIHRPTVVTQGDGILLEVRKGAVTARVAATALESGAVGDRIRVRASGSGLEHFAVIRSGDLARIDLGAKQGNAR